MGNKQIEAIGAIFPAIGRVLGEIAQLLYEQSNLKPCGVYLHGSLAMNCFQLGRSDLDLLIVNRLPATPAHRRRWAARLAAIAGAPCPVELSVVQRAQVEPWQYPTPYDFHWSEAWRERYAQAQEDERAAAWGAPAAPDPDLAAHFTVARRRGLCLAGEPVAALPVVPWADYLDSIRRDLAWAEERAADNPVYAVLNACRVWAAVAAGLVLSKEEGVGWAAAQASAAQIAGARPPVAVTEAIAKAGAVYAGEAGVRVTGEEAQAVVAYVQGQIKKAPATT